MKRKESGKYNERRKGEKKEEIKVKCDKGGEKEKRKRENEKNYRTKTRERNEKYKKII